MATYRLVELAEYVQGVVRGDPNLPIRAIGGLQDVPEGGLTFAEEERHLRLALQSPAAAVLTRPNLVENLRSEKSLLLHPQPRWAFAQLLALFSPFQPPEPGIHPMVVMGEACELGDAVALMPYVVLGNRVRLGHRVRVYPFCYIGDEVEIGDDTVLYPHVVVMPRVRIGQRVILHPGAVIGGDGLLGIKDSSGDPESLHAYLHFTPRLKIWVGEEKLLLANLRGGGAGSISGLANLVPERLVTTFRAFHEGRDADGLQQLIDEIADVVDTFPAPANFKAALTLRQSPLAMCAPLCVTSANRSNKHSHTPFNPIFEIGGDADAGRLF